MSDIGFLEILTLIALILYIYIFLKEFNRGKNLGKLIFHVPRNFNVSASIFFWSLLGCFYFFLLILRLVPLDMYADMNFIRRLMVPTIALLMCLYNILECISHGEIREKGVKIKEAGTVYWKDIIHYRWIKDEELEIVFQIRGLFTLNKKATRTWTIDSEYKEEIDSIFHGYLNSGK